MKDKQEDTGKNVVLTSNIVTGITITWLLLSSLALIVFDFVKYYEYEMYTIGQFSLCPGIVLCFAKGTDKKNNIRIKILAGIMICIGLGVILIAYLYYHGPVSIVKKINFLQPFIVTVCLFLCGVLLLFAPLQHMYYRFFKCKEKVMAQCIKIEVVCQARSYRHNVIYQYTYKNVCYTEEKSYFSRREKHFGPREGECFELFINTDHPECFLDKGRGRDYLFYLWGGISFIILAMTAFYWGYFAG